MNIVKENFDQKVPTLAEKNNNCLESDTYRVVLLGPLMVNSLSRACAA